MEGSSWNATWFIDHESSFREIDYGQVSTMAKCPHPTLTVHMVLVLTSSDVKSGLGDKKSFSSFRKCMVMILSIEKYTDAFHKGFHRVDYGLYVWTVGQ